MKTIYAEAQPGKVVLKEKEIPAPGKGEVLLKAKYSGMSPGTENGLQSISDFRMEEAIKLLIQTDAKMYEIGEKVGYNNVRRFVDAFKQIYSMSPMEYRKTFRED